MKEASAAPWAFSSNEAVGAAGRLRLSHDVFSDDGKFYLERFGKGAQAGGWRSFDHKGVHFVGLVNSAALEGMGKLGAEQTGYPITSQCP